MGGYGDEEFRRPLLSQQVLDNLHLGSPRWIEGHRVGYAGLHVTRLHILWRDRNFWEVCTRKICTEALWLKVLITAGPDSAKWGSVISARGSLKYVPQCCWCTFGLQSKLCMLHG